MNGSQYGPDESSSERPPCRTSNKAVLALILSLFAFCVPILGVVALILGLVAKRDIERSDGTLDGAGLAIAAIVIGVVGGAIGFFIGLAYWSEQFG